MISLSVNFTGGASPALRQVIGALTGAQSSALNESGGRAAVNAAAKYHREFDKSAGWRGPRYLG
jgi:hypothetical protein